MANSNKAANNTISKEQKTKYSSLATHYPWVLRVTEYKDKPVPVIVVKERVIQEQENEEEKTAPKKTILKDRGLIYGQPLRRCLPVIRNILSAVCDQSDIPLELHRFFNNGRIIFRGNLPLDQQAGAKLSLIFKLQERVKDMDRVELIAWRVERFTREEAVYWLSRTTQYGNPSNRWARAGMRILLGGQPGDQAIQEMLAKLHQ